MTPRVLPYGEVIDIYISTLRAGTFLDTVHSRLKRGDRLSPEAFEQLVKHADNKDKDAAKELERYVVKEPMKPSSKTATN